MIHPIQLRESDLKLEIKQIVRQNILEVRLNQIICESENPAFKRSNATQDNLKKIWSVIDAKQAQLQQEVFGELSNGLNDIAREKAKIMGEKFLQIPRNLCKADNKKIPSNVLMINMSSSLLCPSYYLGLCLIKDCACYAQRDENQYSNSVLPDRWKTDLMHTQMLQQYQKGNKSPMKHYFNLVETYIQLANAYCTNLYKKELEDMEFRLDRPLTEQERNFLYVQQTRHKITDIRLNETGDFHCQLAVDLWAKFAEKIKRKYGINTHAYTARNLDFSNATPHITINASHKGINLGDVKERNFIAVTDAEYDSLVGGDKVKKRQPILGYREDKNTWFYKCPCTKGYSGCERCGVCFASNQTGKPYIIYVRYHGQKNARGLKNLFKSGEAKATIQTMRQNDWITDDEFKTYKSSKNRNKFKRVDTGIDTMRNQ